MQDIILKFLKKQHLSSISVLYENLPYSFSAFYAFNEENLSLIIASDDNTKHIKALKCCDKISGTIALSTLIITKIEGVQFIGKMFETNEKSAEVYYKKFPFSKSMTSKLWEIKLEQLKYTNNTLGFGKKIIWTNQNS